MIWLSIDSIVRSVLLKESKPLHYYIGYLSYAASGLQLLNTTTLKNVVSVKLPVNGYKAVALPEDYMDYVRVGLEVGEKVRPLVLDTTLNRLNTYDTQGNKVNYQSAEARDFDVTFDSTRYTGDNDPVFGHDMSRDDYAFNEFRERGELQLSPDYPYDYIILDYITDGQEQVAATLVDPRAKQALESYIKWQCLEHKRSAGGGEKAQAEARFLKDWKLLRSTLNPMTGADYLHVVRGSYTGLYRN